MGVSTLRKMTEHNSSFIDAPAGTNPRKRGQPDDDPSRWANRSTRLTLNLVYIVSFLCLLRFEEALRIQWHWITLEGPDEDGKYRLRIDLPFRKTHQTGGKLLSYCIINVNRD